MAKKVCAAWLVSGYRVVTFALALIFLCPLPGSAKQITLKAWSAFTERHPQSRHLQYFREAVNKRAAGRLEIAWAGGPDLFNAKALPQAIMAGAIDVASGPSGTWPGIVPEGNVETGPFWKVEFAPKLSQELRDGVLSQEFEEKMGMKLLALPLVTQHNIVTKEPVKTLDGLRGLILRGTPGSLTAYIAAVGATPATLSAEEVYMALERGLINGAVRPVTSYIQYKEYEIAKHIISNPFVYSTLALWIRLDAWKKLPGDIQQIVMEEADRLHERMPKVFVNDFTDGKKLTQGYGVTWHDLPAADAAKLETAVLKSFVGFIRKDVRERNAEKILKIIGKYFTLS